MSKKTYLLIIIFFNFIISSCSKNNNITDIKNSNTNIPNKTSINTGSTLNIDEFQANDLTEDENLNNQGVILLEEGKYNQAIEYFDKALSLNPNSEDYRYNKGLVYFAIADNQNAIKCFDKVLELNSNITNPIDTDSIEKRGFALYNLGVDSISQNNFSKAKSYFEEVLKTNPEDINAFNGLGIIYYNLKDYQQSVDYFNKSLNLDIDNLSANNGKGGALFKLGKFDQALKYFNKTLEIDPNNQEAQKNKEIVENMNKIGK